MSINIDEIQESTELIVDVDNEANRIEEFKSQFILRLYCLILCIFS